MFSESISSSTAKQNTTKTEPKLQLPTESVLPTKPSSVSSVASKVMKDPVYGLDKDYLDEICQLVTTRQSKATEKTTSPAEFFQKLGVELTSKDIFTQEDIQQIYRMMSAHPMCDKIPFYALFGLETYDILQTLKSLEKFVSPEEYQLSIAEWSALYIYYYRTISFSDKNLQLIDDFSNGIKSMLETSLKAKLPKSHEHNSSRYKLSMTLYRRHEAEYNSTVVPLLQRLQTTLNLLKKFLSHNQSKRLLHDVVLITCLGSESSMQFSSLEDAQNAIEHFRKYTTFINESVLLLNSQASTRNKVVCGLSSKLPARFSAMFVQIAKVINSQDFGQTLNLEQSKIQCNKIVRLINENIVTLYDYSARYTGNVKYEEIPVEVQSGLIFCCITWMKDFYNVLHHSIISLIIPSDETDQAYERRVFFNLGVFPTNIKSEFFSLKESSAPTLFKKDYGEFLKVIFSIYPYMEAISTNVTKYCKYNIRSFQMVTKEMEAFYAKLKPLTDDILDKLCESAKKNPGDLLDMPLVDMTAGLAQALIMVHDMDMLLHGGSHWSYELPDKYLDFICMERDTESEEDEELEESPSSTQEFLQEEASVTDFSSLPLSLQQEESVPASLDSSFSNLGINESSVVQLPPKSSTLETKEPPRSQSKALRRRSSTTLEPHKPMVERPSDSPVQSSSHYNIDINVKKVRKLKKVFRKLKLTRIEGGDHAKMRFPKSKNNPDGKKVATVVSRHGGGQVLGIGVRQAMRRQIRNNNPEKKDN